MQFSTRIAHVLVIGALACNIAIAQFSMDEKTWLEQLNLQGGLPEKLLSTRTVVFYDYTLTDKEVKDMQQSFQRTGVDAVAYFELDMLTAGKDVTKAFAEYLDKREVTNLMFVQKSENGFRIIGTPYNGKENVIDKQQAAWSHSNSNLNEALKELYRASSYQKRQNLLINDRPETGLKINPILGNRNEFYAIDLKVDPLAVPKTGDELVDKELEGIFKLYYPLKYKMTEPGTSEKELRRQGSLYVVCFVHTRGVVAKDLLGYDMSKSESALVSVTYPDNQQQLKSISSNTPVYKFYFKHIDSGNVFFGTKWDADLTWEQALINQIKGMKAELRLN